MYASSTRLRQSDRFDRAHASQFICVDCEHGNIDDMARDSMVNAIAACGISPMVRVARHDDFIGMKRSLDGGAQ